jgi:hypothetical protein
MMGTGAAVTKITDEVKKFISSYGNVVEYAELVDPETFQPIKSVKSVPIFWRDLVPPLAGMLEPTY